MFRNLALVGLTIVSVTGCRDDSNPAPVDLSRPISGDMAVDPNADLSMTQMMTATTIHDIDTEAVSSGTAVKLTGVISVDNVHRHLSGTTMYCEYRTIVTDANCSTPPCGIELYQRGKKLAAGMTTTDCPFADASGSMTDLGLIKTYGDVMDITGSVKSFTDSTAPMMVKLHSLTVDTLTVTMNKGPLPTPIAVTDDAVSKFVPHSGAGWNMFEGTYIKLSPNGGGKFTTGTPDNFGAFTVTPGGALFDTSDYFGPKDAGTFPMPGSMYSTIAGVVNNDFGGSIVPLLPGDYQP